MEFWAIFDEKGDLFGTCYPEDMQGEKQCDIFDKLFSLWSDTEYLRDFFLKNKTELARPFWRGITIDQAINQVLKEVEFFEDELWAMDTRQAGSKTIKEIFKPLHDNIFSVHFNNEQDRKARPDLARSMLRIYGTELEDGTIVITGGVIKVTEKMVGEEYDKEFAKLDRVKRFLKEQGIINKAGLIA